MLRANFILKCLLAATFVILSPMAFAESALDGFVQKNEDRGGGSSLNDKRDDKTNGICGPMNGSNFANLPSASYPGLCKAGRVGSPTRKKDSQWFWWYCNGLHGGKSSACSGWLSVDASCGPKNGALFDQLPDQNTSGLCGTGLTGKVQMGGGNNWFWWPCYGKFGGKHTVCKAALKVAVNGQCAKVAPFAKKPGNELCEEGIPDQLARDGIHWTWTCKGKNGGSDDATCSAYHIAHKNVMSVDPDSLQLLSNGVPFKVNGLEYTAFVGPVEWLQTGNTNSNNGAFTSYLNARKDFMADPVKALDRARMLGANTVEFKVGQAGLAPHNAPEPIAPERIAYSPDYEKEVVDAVRLARSEGFVVLVSMQDTEVSGGPASPHPGLGNMGTSVTKDAAVSLGQLFADDPGIMIELVVEPWGSTCGWPCYIQGGKDDAGNLYVGINDILFNMRLAHVGNLVVVEPLVQDFSAYYNSKNGNYPFGKITDAPWVKDRLIYGLHPYLEFDRIGVKQQSWDAAFGDFSKTHPVLITEWNENTMRFEEWCTPIGEMAFDGKAGLGGALTTPLEMLHYLSDPERHIAGLIGWAIDIPTTLLRKDGSLMGMCTNGKPARCGPMQATGNKKAGSFSGVAEWIQDYFGVDDRTLPPIDEPLCGSN